MSLQNFIDNNLPTVKAAWLNLVDGLMFTVFDQAQTKATARTALTSDAPWSVAQGGTGQTTKTAAFDALSPLSTKGDLVTFDGGDNVRMPVGTNGYVLQAKSGGTEGIDYLPPGVAPGLMNGSVFPSATAGALTVQIVSQPLGGNPSATQPVYAFVRSSNVALSGLTLVEMTSDMTLTVPSGATLGAVSNQPFRLWFVLFLDGATPRTGVINTLIGTPPNHQIYPLNAWEIVGSTAIGTGSDSAGVFYTGSAVSAKSYTILGYATWESGLATPGTWTSPSRVQMYMADTPLPGCSVQSVREQTGAVATGTTTIPVDDTIPQNTEGDEYLDVVITPTSAANLLRVEANVFLASSAGTRRTLALFRDATTDAIAVTGSSGAAADVESQHEMNHAVLAGSTSATTFNLRAGTSIAATLTFNGFGAARKYGGVIASYIQAEEIMT